MKKSLLIITAIVLMAGFSTSVFAQTKSNTISNDASAQLIIPLKLVKVNPLNFGTVNLGTGVLGTVVLNTSGGTSFTGGVSTSSFKSTPSNASYTVSGTYNQTYALTIDNTITLTAANGALGGVKTLTVNNLTVSFTNTPAEVSVSGATSTLSASGEDGFKIGGTLNLVDNQAGGIYSGVFLASVEYN